jgi:ABC-type transport system substrate-binding protein
MRWVVLLAVFAIFVAACGGDDDDDTSTTADAADTTAAPADTTAAPTETTAAPTDTTGATDTTMAGGDGMIVANEAGCAEDYTGKISSIEATASHEVVFTLCSPDPAFLAKLAFVPFSIQPAEHLEATGGSPLDNPIGTGPFMLDNWARGSEIVFTRNDSYWGEAPSFSTLVFRWAEESTSRILELQSGTADFATNLAASDYATIEGDANLQLLPDLNPNIFYVGFNNTFPPFDDPLVRQAIAMGIDRDRIVDTFYPTGSEVATHFTPCSIPNGCEGEDWYEFDPEGARELLAQAGYEDGFETTISLRDVFRVYLPEPQVVAQDIQTQLAENLGITAEISVQESGAFIEAANAGTLEGIHLLGWGADYPHVTNFLDYHFNGNIQFGESDPAIMDALTRGAAEVDEAAAAPIYEEANNLIREFVPMVPIVWGAAADAALASVGAASVAPFGAPQFATMDPGDDDFVFVQNAEPISLYCPDESDGESLSACEQVVESLYGYDLDGTVIPKLAESCDPNEDGTIWTCALRQGVTFHDGSDFDSGDVIASWGAMMDASNPLHTGNTGLFTYPEYLWGGLMNPPAG